MRKKHQIKTAKKHKNTCFLNCYKNIKNIFYIYDVYCREPTCHFYFRL